MKSYCLAILSLLSQPALGWVPQHAQLVNRNTLAFNSKSNVDAAACSFEDALKIGADVCQSLQAGNSESTTETLGALLSHGNGIRGFFVHWLSDPSVTIAEDAALPPTLLESLGESLPADCVQVVVMNAIMPTAMVVSYTELDNLEAAANSGMTARRGTTVLKAAHACNEPLRQQVANALKAAKSFGSNEAPDDKDVQFWTTFYKKWGYEAAHIAKIESMLQGVSGA